MSQASDRWRRLKDKTPKLKPDASTKMIVHDHDYSVIFNEDDGFSQKKTIRLKNKFSQIRTLIKSKKYDQARKELYKINHPTAEKWLQQLDEIDPQGSNLSPLEVKINIFDFIILLILVSGVVVLAVQGYLTSENAIQAVFAISGLFLIFLWLRNRRMI